MQGLLVDCFMLFDDCCLQICCEDREACFRIVHADSGLKDHEGVCLDCVGHLMDPPKCPFGNLAGTEWQKD